MLFVLVLELDADADTETAEVVLLMLDVVEMIGRVNEADVVADLVTGIAALLLADTELEP